MSCVVFYKKIKINGKNAHLPREELISCVLENNSITGLYSLSDFSFSGYTCADNATLEMFSYRLNACHSIFFYEVVGMSVYVANHPVCVYTEGKVFDICDCNRIDRDIVRETMFLSNKRYNVSE